MHGKSFLLGKSENKNLCMLNFPPFDEINYFK